MGQILQYFKRTEMKMKIIEVDEELYQYIASQTQSIGESASDILRRLLNLPALPAPLTKFELVPDDAPKIHTEKHQAETRFNGTFNNARVRVSDVPEEPLKPLKKQSDSAISQMVDKVRHLLNSEEFRHESKAVVRFLSILRVLYRTYPESFAQATESLQGRTRIYFARDEASLLLAGTHTKPKQIPDTPYWVITNTNSARKMLMLEGTMQSMDLPQALIEDVRGYFIANA